jgi:hypothetical protein
LLAARRSPRHLELWGKLARRRQNLFAALAISYDTSHTCAKGFHPFIVKLGSHAWIIFGLSVQVQAFLDPSLSLLWLKVFPALPWVILCAHWIRVVLFFWTFAKYESLFYIGAEGFKMALEERDSISKGNVC